MKKQRQQKPKGFVRLMTIQLMTIPGPLRSRIMLSAYGEPSGFGTDASIGLTIKRKGVTITQAWSTASLLDSKVELTDAVAPGVKIDLQNLWNPSKEGSAAQKVNFAFKNPNVHSRAFVNYATAKGNIDAIVDVVAGSDGFLVGGEAGYDVQKAAVTRYSLGLGYQTPSYVASIVGTQNLTQIAASYYQKVNSAVEVGAKAGYDVQAQKASGLELASKYKLDPLSFAKVSSLMKLQEFYRSRTDIFDRPRSTTAVLQLSPTAPSSTQEPLSALVFRSTPSRSTRLATRSAPRLPLRVRCNKRRVENSRDVIEQTEEKRRAVLGMRLHYSILQHTVSFG